MKVESIANCSPWSILQYFWPALSNIRYWKTIFCVLFEWPLKTGFTVFKENYEYNADISSEFSLDMLLTVSSLFTI